MARKMLKLTAVLLMAMMLITMTACKSEADTSEKTINVTVMHADESVQEFEIETEAAYLAEALVEEGIIEYREDGYYTTVDGETADYSKDKGWWKLTKDGEMTSEGFNTQPITDGDRFEITYTIG